MNNEPMNNEQLTMKSDGGSRSRSAIGVSVVHCSLFIGSLFIAFVAAVPIFSAISTPLVAADWPIFRGNPLQTGISKDTLPDQLEILWKFETGDAVESTAAIVDGIVYIASLDQHLYALDLKDGKLLWKYKA